MNRETGSFIPKDVGRSEEHSDGVEKLLGMIEAKRGEQGDTPTVVMIAGRTSSGKTTAVTSEITRTYKDEATVLSMDDYSKGNSFVAEMKAAGTPINWDHPSYIDFDLLNQHVDALKRGETIDKPTFSFKTGERSEPESVSPSKVMVVEGLFALRDEIQHQADIKAFVDISLHGSVIRRLLRDVKRTTMEPVDILRYYLKTVEPMYQEHIAETKANADVVIVNEYDPTNEASKSEVYEVQTKFEKPADIKTTLQRAGAEFLGRVHEEDTYLQPPDKDFAISDEVIRIRNRDGVKTLGYKGTRIESGVRTRPKFEFEIDAEIEGELLATYGEKLTDVSKKRSLYHLDGAIIAVDEEVLKTYEGEAMPLGSFVEIRSDDKEHGEEKIKTLSTRLGLDYAAQIRASYSEM